MKRLLVLAALCASAWAGAAACSTGGKSAAAAPPPTPTPSVGRVNPYVIEEYPTYVIERYPKEGHIRVDDHHFRNPVIGLSVEFFKEDGEYYYVKTEKFVPEEEAARKEAQRRLGIKPPDPDMPPPSRSPTPPPGDFESVTPARIATRFQLEEVKDSGLPDEAMWRASFAVADMNGDGIPDIVAPPPRIAGDANLRIWLGDGKGHFTPWKLTFVEKGKESPNYELTYGGVAVGDVDGDGNLDVVAASHNKGLIALFGDGRGKFVVSGAGFTGSNFSTQAVALADLNGDGKLDVIASADTYETGATSWNREQVRVYLYKGNRAFERRAEGIVDASFSYTAEAWDFDRDGRKDVLLGSRYYGAVLVLFRNMGDGTLSSVVVPDVEVWAYHLALAGGTFGKDRAAAFADLFYKGGSSEDKPLRAAGINLHVYRKGQWEKRPVWREKSGNAVLSTIAFGDLDGDGLDDIVFPDTFRGRLRIFLQQADGTFKEAEEKDEPAILPVAQAVRLADLDRDGRLDVVLSKTVVGGEPNQGGWSVFLNRRK